MVITRTSILNNARNELGIQPGDNLPPINLTYPTHAKYTTILKNTQVTSSGTTTIYTTPQNKDFYLTLVHLSYFKNAVCDGDTVSVYSVVNGLNTTVIRLLSNALTAYQDHAEIVFPHPIKLDRNAAIVLSRSFGAGTETCNLLIGGIILE